MIALALVLLLAPVDTTTLVPGTPLRFGMRLAAAEARGFTGSAEGGGRTGSCRFFGLPCEGTLFFTGERLVRAEFAIAEASDYEERYVEDELRRQGYRRDCVTLNPTQSDCVWNGRTKLALTVAGQTIKAVAEPRGSLPPPTAVVVSATPSMTTRPAAPKREPLPAASPPREKQATSLPARVSRPETLSVAAAPLRTRFAHVRAQYEQAPLYPEAARRARVQGRVWVMALVAHDGHVLDASIMRGIPELNRAAIAAVMHWRFRPVEGSTSTYWVEIPVLFRLF